MGDGERAGQEWLLQNSHETVLDVACGLISPSESVAQAVKAKAERRRNARFTTALWFRSRRNADQTELLQGAPRPGQWARVSSTWAPPSGVVVARFAVRRVAGPRERRRFAGGPQPVEDGDGRLRLGGARDEAQPAAARRALLHVFGDRSAEQLLQRKAW